ncbi:EI24 domain-containing protein [Bdellovibrio sp. HCB337]|uniref:EI24 domain-containing protein n=1 Tax=Bdellovibrio sp. HCB337 TaxID=3394358 RepID=UPI0039A6BDEB
MDKIFRALKQSFQACGNPRILFLLFLPFMLAVFVGLVLFFTLGTWWITAASTGIEQSFVMQYISEKWNILSSDSAASVSYFFVLIVTILLLIPFSYLVAVILVSLVLLPFILRILEKKDYPSLDKKRGGSFSGSLWNTLKVSVIYLVALSGTLFLWLVPGFAIVIPLLLSAYLNKNLFVYDVLEEFASVEERQRIEKENRGLLYGLGVILGLINYVPLAFVVAPTFASLAYSYFCLNALKDLRENRP